VSTRKNAPLPPRQVRAIARALSDPNRYQILKMVAADSIKACTDLRKAFDITAPTLSHHLKELESAGLVEIVHRGKFAEIVFCRDVWDAYMAELAQI